MRQFIQKSIPQPGLTSRVRAKPKGYPLSHQLSVLPSEGFKDFRDLPIQTKCAGCSGLKIGSPNDPLEQEADRMADRVMRKEKEDDQPSPISPCREANTLRRNSESPYSMAEGRIVDDEEETIQAKFSGRAPTAIASPSAAVHAAVSRVGAPLPPSTRCFFENRFGHDFSNVRIHTDTTADRAAKSVSARAFTMGGNIAFARGQYAPQSSQGMRLLAHELTHVLQQRGASKCVHRPSRKQQASIAAEEHTVSLQKDGFNTLRRVKWGKAKDTGQDSYPWGSGPKGDVLDVPTNAGTMIKAWKPHDGKTYWCHGFTFGGASAPGGPFSTWGEFVHQIVKDDGWSSQHSCHASQGDILVFADKSVAHSGIASTVSAPNSLIDESASKLNSKWGNTSQNKKSWLENASHYKKKYSVFSKNPITGVCAGKGPNEH